jgi:predicted transcriptional regulator
VRSFGELESRIMHVFWSAASPITVHDVVDALEGKPVAYTTAITVIERLRTKGWLARERAGRSFLYSASLQEADYAAKLMSEALDEVDDRRAALLNFAGTLTAEEVDELRSALGAGGT